jgi:hypothetical protein
MPNEILPGISLDAAGQVTVDKRMGELLFNLALQLEDLQLEDLQLENAVSAPVDVEHVLAAIVLAAREGEINADTPLTKDDAELLEILRRHLKTVFERYGGQLGRDDC